MVDANAAIVIDSTCDLSDEVLAERQIHLLPLYIQWGAQTMRDRLDISRAEFYNRLEQSSESPTTSAPTVGDFVEVFEKARAAVNAEAVICITLSRKLSATHQNALLAAEMVDFPVAVVDSESTSLESGYLALAAADGRDAGLSLDEILLTLDEAKSKTHLYFSVGSLEYLRRGGRIGEARRFIGDLLAIKPVLYANDGEVGVYGSVRTRKRLLRYLVDTIENVKGEANFKHVTVVHGQADDHALLAEMLEGRFQYDTVNHALISAVLGIHLGPGSIGIAVHLT
jgi:DegV family protein with EDD domain